MSDTLLLVEDELPLARGVADYLRHARYQVVAVSRGNVVLEAVRQHRPDLVVLDVMRPGCRASMCCGISERPAA
jgi:two-component system response regulator BaeR